MHRVVADTNCVVSCPQCNDADNAGTSEADSQTTLIVGLASGLLVMFCPATSTWGLTISRAFRSSKPPHTPCDVLDRVSILIVC